MNHELIISLQAMIIQLQETIKAQSTEIVEISKKLEGLLSSEEERINASQHPLRQRSNKGK